MPRDSNGEYTLPISNPVSPDTVIETDWANPTMQDLGAEIESSLDRSGRGPMLAPLHLADGVGAGPGLAFSIDPATGIWRDPFDGSMYITVSGQDAVQFFLDTTDPLAPVAAVNFIADVSFGSTTTTFADGTVLQPGIRFTDELTSGLYRAGTNDIRWDVGQTDMVVAAKADGVRFPYSGAGSQVSLRRASGTIMREAVNAANEFLLVNGARQNVTGDGLLAEVAQVDALRISPAKFTVELATGQVIGNTVVGAVEALKVDSTGVYAQGNKLATESVAVLKAGDTMTGQLVLAADPAAAMQATTKQYVDAADLANHTILNGTAAPSAGIGNINDFYVQTGLTTAAVLDTSSIGSMSWRHAESTEWKQLQGQTLSKTTFPQLWAYAQSYLTSDQVVNPGLYKDLGGDNFAVPVANGLFLRNIGGTAAALGVLQAEMIGPHTHVILPAGHSALVSGGSNGFTAGTGVPTGLTIQANTGTENRPKNIALILCVRALPITIAAATTTGTAIWGPKTGAGWPATGVPLAQGPTGATGPTGPTGATGSTGATGAAGGEARNYIINGGLDVWQRGTSFSNPTSAGSFYTADRFGFNRSGDVAGSSISRQAGPGLGSRYCLLWQRAPGDTSAAQMSCFYALETADSAALANKTVTFSLWATKGANYSGGALQASLVYGTGTDQRCYAFTGFTTVAAVNCTLTTSWQRFTVTGTIPNTATEVGFQFAWVPSGTAGAVDAVFFTAVQLEVGASATNYTPRPFAEELILCSRYYQKGFTYGTAPANFTSDYGSGAKATLATNSTASPGALLVFKPAVRTFPTMAFYNPRPGGGAGRFTTGAADDTGAATANNCTTDGGAIVAASNLAQGFWFINWTADAEL